jgi:hypothetical protein
MARTSLLWVLTLLLGAAFMRTRTPLRAPSASKAARTAWGPGAAGENPFLQRRAGVFEPLYPDRAVQDFGDLKGFLWYADFATDPDGSPNDFTTHEQFEQLFRQAESHGMVLQLGFEPAFVSGGAFPSLHLGTLTEALDLPHLRDQVARINRALDQGQDPLTRLTPRPVRFEVLISHPGGKDAWVPVREDLNVFLVNTVKWGRYLGRRKAAVILRPLSEMNDPSAGSWCFGRRPENTPENYAHVWVALVSILRLSGASNAYFVLAPQAYRSPPPMANQVLAAVNSIRRADSTAIDAFGMDAYPASDASHRPISFDALVQPWLSLLRSQRLPFTVPEMGIDRSTFRDDSVRSAWVLDAFRSARRLGFVNVNYFHATNPPMDFTVLPRPGGYAMQGEKDCQALKQGLAEFQAR